MGFDHFKADDGLQSLELAAQVGEGQGRDRIGLGEGEG